MDLTVLLLGLAVLVAFYMAWNIGANDVANTMGTSVGSRALTIKQAVIVAAIFEFSGAFFVGDQVTNTIQNGIVNPHVFADTPYFFAVGMLGALVVTAFWLQFASFRGLPVSTTHSIVGAVLGFGIVSAGVDAIHWGILGGIVASWFLSPLLGGMLSFGLFFIIRRYILDSATPIASMKMLAPILMFSVLSMLLAPFLRKSLPKFLTIQNSDIWGIILGLAIALIISAMARILMEKAGVDRANREQSLNKIEKVFSFIQPITACFLALGHGSNDVANAIGPVAAVVAVLKEGSIVVQSVVPFWLLALGGFGIVVGLGTYGRRVIATVGQNITEITPTRGFSAEFGAAFTILLGSILGLPLSSTQVLVGCIVGVGLARGIAGLNITVIKKIMSSWVITIPATGVISAVISLILKQLF